MVLCIYCLFVCMCAVCMDITCIFSVSLNDALTVSGSDIPTATARHFLLISPAKYRQMSNLLLCNKNETYQTPLWFRNYHSMFSSVQFIWNLVCMCERVCKIFVYTNRLTSVRCVRIAQQTASHVWTKFILYLCALLSAATTTLCTSVGTMRLLQYARTVVSAKYIYRLDQTCCGHCTRSHLSCCNKFLTTNVVNVVPQSKKISAACKTSLHIQSARSLRFYSNHYLSQHLQKLNYAGLLHFQYLSREDQKVSFFLNFCSHFCVFDLISTYFESFPSFGFCFGKYGRKVYLPWKRLIKSSN